MFNNQMMIYVLPQDNLSGLMHIHNAGPEAKFDAITVSVEGMVSLQISNKTVGLFDALSNSIKVVFYYI